MLIICLIYYGYIFLKKIVNANMEHLRLRNKIAYINQNEERVTIKMPALDNIFPALGYKLKTTICHLDMPRVD